MKVTLIGYTPNALEMLLFTRETRLTMTPGGMLEIMAWDEERKLRELEHARNTIQSSWEFVDYTFAIQDVTRAFTHQLVRHRAGTSFAQQAQRVVDMSGFTYETGPSIRGTPQEDQYRDTMREIAIGYRKLVEGGVNKQDARGVLPTNICTNIVFKANLRTLHDMGLKRLCVKAQGEFQDVFRAIKSEVVKVHPWAERFIRVNCAWSGTCCFPDFPAEDCPVKMWVYDPEKGRAYSRAGYPSTPAKTPDAIQEVWNEHRAEAQPVVKR